MDKIYFGTITFYFPIFKFNRLEENSSCVVGQKDPDLINCSLINSVLVPFTVGEFLKKDLIKLIFKEIKILNPLEVYSHQFQREDFTVL